MPEPVLGSLPPRGQMWEMTRYRAYQAQLAGHTIGETFGRPPRSLSWLLRTRPHLPDAPAPEQIAHLYTCQLTPLEIRVIAVGLSAVVPDLVTTGGPQHGAVEDSLLPGPTEAGQRSTDLEMNER